MSCTSFFYSDYIFGLPQMAIKTTKRDYEKRNKKRDVVYSGHALSLKCKWLNGMTTCIVSRLARYLNWIFSEDLYNLVTVHVAATRMISSG